MLARSLACAVLLPATLLPALADGIGASAIEAAGTSYPAIVAGEGPPVVFVHGMLGDNRVWAGLAEATAAHGHRFVAYTQRGFGPGSRADEPFSRDRLTDDLLAILAAAGEPADLVGWSYAGPIVLRAAARAPDRVRRVVLFEPYVPELIADDTPAHRAANEAFGAAMGPTAEAMEAGDTVGAARAAVEALLGLGAGGFAAEPPELQAIQLDNAPTFAAFWNAGEPTAMTCAELGTIRAPTLVMTGSTTLPAFAEMSKAVAACIPGATTATMEGVGHGGPVAARDAFGHQVLDFIDGS